MLECAGHEDARVVGEDVLRAVAVMHVEVDHRHPLESVFFQRMGGGNGDVVEEAEAHRLRPLGMVAWRAHAAKGVFGLAADMTRSVASMPAPAERSAACQRAGAHGGIRVEVDDAALGCVLADMAHVFRRVDADDLLQRGEGRIVESQIEIQPGGDQPVADGGEALRALRMVRTHIVQPAVAVGDEGSGHVRHRSSPDIVLEAISVSRAVAASRWLLTEMQ
jgi:hypothetical protein